MKYLILAGGFATRLWPISENCAKPLLLVNGQTILEHLLDTCRAGGVDMKDIILLTNQRFRADFEKLFTQKNIKDIQFFIEDSHAEGEKLGALRAIARCLEHFDITSDFAVLAGDNLLPELQVSDFMIGAGVDAQIITRQVSDHYEAQKFGIVETDSDGVVVGFEEKPSAPKSLLALTGFMSLSGSIRAEFCRFAEQEPDALGSIFTHLLSLGKTITTTQKTGQWYDIGSFETYLQAHTELQTEKLLAPNAQVKNCTLQGKVFIGKDSQVENCQLIDTIIYPGAKLKNTYLAQCIVGANVSLQGVDLSRKLIRPETKLDADQVDQ